MLPPERSASEPSTPDRVRGSLQVTVPSGWACRRCASTVQRNVRTARRQSRPTLSVAPPCAAARGPAAPPRRGGRGRQSRWGGRGGRGGRGEGEEHRPVAVGGRRMLPRLGRPFRGWLWLPLLGAPPPSGDPAPQVHPPAGGEEDTLPAPLGAVRPGAGPVVHLVPGVVAPGDPDSLGGGQEAGRGREVGPPADALRGLPGAGRVRQGEGRPGDPDIVPRGAGLDPGRPDLAAGGHGQRRIVGPLQPPEVPEVPEVPRSPRPRRRHPLLHRPGPGAAR